MGGGSNLIVPGTSDIVIPAYTDTQLTVKGDADLIAANILKGKEIFGVTGTLVKGVSGIQYGKITPSTASVSITINHNLGAEPTYVAVIKELMSPSSYYVRILAASMWKDATYGHVVAGSYNSTEHLDVSFNSFISNQTKNSITLNVNNSAWDTDIYYWFALA